MTGWRIWPCIAVAAVLAGCPTPPLPAGNLADPSALTVVPSMNCNVAGVSCSAAGIVINPANLVMIAEGDGQDMKAFVPAAPAAGGSHLFIRGPNDITALSIPLATTLSVTLDGGTDGGTNTLPSFRAERLAGSAAPDTSNINDGGPLGYVVAAGTASRLAVIDTQFPTDGQPQFPATVSADDNSKCTATPQTSISVSCLPQPAIDVVATPPVAAANAYAATQDLQLSQAIPTAENARVYALLAPDPVTGAQSIVVMIPSIEKQQGGLFAGDKLAVLSIDASRPRIELPEGKFIRMTVGLDPSGSGAAKYLYLADATPGTQAGVLRVWLHPAPRLPSDVIMERFATPGPVRVAVPVPENVSVLKDGGQAAGGIPAGRLVLAVLQDGSIATIDSETKMAALDSPGPDGGSSLPIVPTNFGSPAEDIVFMPCPAANCTIQTTATTNQQTAIVAMVALGDGTAAPLVPGTSTGGAQIYQPVSLSTTYPAASEPTYYPLPAYGIPPVVMSTPTNMTTGLTHSESITATFNGNLPGFDGRQASFQAVDGVDGGIGGFLLTDPEGLGTAPMIYPEAGPATPVSACVNGTGPYPQNCSYPLIGDRVRITAIDPGNTIGCAINVELPIVGYAPGALQLGQPTTGSLVNCVPDAVSYDALAAAEPTEMPQWNTPQDAIGAWTVFGTFTGYLGRASSVTFMEPVPIVDAGVVGVEDAGMEDAGSIEFSYYGVPFFYPTSPPTYHFDPGQTSFSFNLTQGDPTIPACEDCTLSFATTSGFGPLTYSSTASISGLSISVAVVNYTLYMAVEGADSLTEVDVPAYSLNNGTNGLSSVNDYR